MSNLFQIIDKYNEKFGEDSAPPLEIWPDDTITEEELASIIEVAIKENKRIDWEKLFNYNSDAVY